MTTQTVLLLGGTGRTGGRVLQQLLERRIRVRAIVRSSERLPREAMNDPGLTVIEADLLSLSDEELQRYLLGCDSVISCLGHTITLRGIFGAPRDLVTQAAAALCRGIEALAPETPIRFILMSSVSVNASAGSDGRRGALERAVLAALRALVPPAKDNQRAAEYLAREVGATNPYIHWVAVRPDTLLEGDISEYSVHPGLVSTLFKPDSTSMANVAHFMCELATQAGAWESWEGKLPVIVNAVGSGRPA